MMSMPLEFVASFGQSMPEAYRHQHTPDDVREHAQIVWRRGQELAHAEIWTKRMNVVVVCIVTDERPGLPSLIQATIAAHGLEVQRRRPGVGAKNKGRPKPCTCFGFAQFDTGSKRSS
jgi:UTP:GlnB (protein PII) uridylyltransferase